jgi:hypothetical protein
VILPLNPVESGIHRFSARGEHLLTFGGGDSVFIPKRFNLGPVTGRPGTDPCQFNVPHELLVTDDNLVYVMDRENHRWQVFTTDGTFVSMQEHVSHPNRVALDADGTFHIAGGAGIEIWKRDGTKIGSWGEKGEAPGQFVAGSVHGAWMDTDGALYTAEASRNLSFRQACLTSLHGSVKADLMQRPTLDPPCGGAHRVSTPQTSPIPPRDQSQS